jgi:regulation of enolase protein 1 (concanavalin A-like superfamily)
MFIRIAILVAFLATTISAAQFSVVGTTIRDPSGAVYIPVGANVNGKDWVWNDETTRHLSTIRDGWRFNFLRVNCMLNPVNTQWPTFTVNNDLKKIIDTYTAHGIVVSLEIHDWTGKYPDDTQLLALTKWWRDIAVAYRDNPYVWFNIMNEPGGSGAVSSRYLTVHQAAIRAIRQDAGANNVIVVDGASWGQDTGAWSDNPVPAQNSGILTYGSQLKAFDGRTWNNIVFSVHCYDQWAYADSKFEDYIDRVHAAGHALFVGEFGGYANNTTNHLYLSAQVVNRVALNRGVGIVWWHYQPGDGFALTMEGGGSAINSLTNPTNLSWGGRILWDATHTYGFGLGAAVPQPVNQPPSVALTAPITGASVVQGTAITLTANASDADGTVAKVAFYQGSTLIAEDSTSPYSIAWTGASVGTHSLTARASDNAGATTTSTPISITVTAVPLPAPWVAADIGSTTPSGSTSLSNGTFTLRGAGADIWDTADGFHFVSQPISGDCTITARVSSLQNTHEWAKAGVMIRESTAAGSRHGLMAVTPQGGASFQRRLATNGTSTSTTQAGIAAPQWLRLVRSGNTVTGYRSVNGSTWVQVGSDTIAMSASVRVGLALTSHLNGSLCTAVFDQVSITTSAPPVNQAPSVALTAPAADSSSTAPASITLSADASDSDGAVARVDFFAGSTQIGSRSTAPYSITWTDVAAGSYSLTARATDDAGASTTSAPVAITVVEAPATSEPYGGSPAAVPGRIEAERFDLGGQGVAYFDTTADNQGGAFRSGEFVDIQGTSDTGGGFNVGWIADGEWIDYTIDAAAGRFDIDLRVASAVASPGSFRLSIGGRVLATVAVPGTGNWQGWRTITIPDVELAAGRQILRVSAVGELMNLNWIEFRKLGDTTFDMVQVNFQPAAAATPAGWLADSSAVYGDRGNGFSYGWTSSFDETRDRNASNAPDQVHDTLNHMLKTTPRVWEMALPNGVYQVRVLRGDPSYTDQVNHLLVEGVRLADPDGQDHFDDGTVWVEVTDGRLTIEPAADAQNAKICAVEVIKAVDG